MTAPEQSSPLTLRPLMLRPEDAAAVVGIGRTKMYELLASGEIPSVLIGAARCVPYVALEQYVARLVAGRTDE